MIRLVSQTKKQLIDLSKSDNVILEGNIIKLIDYENDNEFKEYIESCLEKDKSNRKRRLDITKQIQTKNSELVKLNNENQRILIELQETLRNVEDSKTQIEIQNTELIEWKKNNENLTEQLKSEMLNSERARLDAEGAKQNAENDLDILQKKTQFQLINSIVKMALLIIISVGFMTTAMYATAIYTNKDTQIIGSTWSNMLGILLTNAFSIVGTIMGIKYASKEQQEG
jgi:hypothetical protein